MSLVHYTLVGHFTFRRDGLRDGAVARPIDPDRVARLLAEYPPAVGEHVALRDGYAHCQWAPGPAEVYDFAYRLAREEGCLAVENGRQVTYPPAAALTQDQGWDEPEARTLTAGQWAAGRQPGPMLLYLRGRASARKLGLFACACGRRVWDLVPDDRPRRAIEVAERYADGAASPEERAAAEQAAHDWDRDAGPDAGSGPWYAGQAALSAILATAGDTRPEFFAPWRAAAEAAEAVPAAARSGEWAAQAGLARDIFGDPFRPAVFDPRWRTADVVGLARGIYDDRAFERLPLLADALMDAGCEDEEVLSHCRPEGPHVRGCWVIDLALGRE